MVDVDKIDFEKVWKTVKEMGIHSAPDVHGWCSLLVVAIKVSYGNTSIEAAEIAFDVFFNLGYLIEAPACILVNKNA